MAHHVPILQGLGVVPSDAPESSVHRTVIQQATSLSTYPHTALQVKLYGIDIRPQLASIMERQPLMVNNLMG